MLIGSPIIVLENTPVKIYFSIVINGHGVMPWLWLPILFGAGASAGVARAICALGNGSWCMPCGKFERGLLRIAPLNLRAFIGPFSTDHFDLAP